MMLTIKNVKSEHLIYGIANVVCSFLSVPNLSFIDQDGARSIPERPPSSKECIQGKKQLAGVRDQGREFGEGSHSNTTAAAETETTGGSEKSEKVIHYVSLKKTFFHETILDRCTFPDLDEDILYVLFCFW